MIVRVLFYVETVGFNSCRLTSLWECCAVSLSSGCVGVLRYVLSSAACLDWLSDCDDYYDGGGGRSLLLKPN